jgi:hypothetical protein
MYKKIVLLALIFISVASAQTPLGSEFTYQGNLEINNTPANGEFDFTFKLYDNITLGNQINNDVIINDIMVSDGIFTSVIDFNSTAFAGEKVWLEIYVRNGAETGAFQQLFPRQQITSTPYAIHAQFVGVDAISSLEIQNGSIATVDLANDSVTADKIATGSVGTNHISSNSISTTAIIDNSVSNAKIAENAITKDKIDINAVGTTEILSSQVQRRISSTCATGFYINTINEDGTVVCEVDDTGISNISITSAEIVDETIATIDLSDNSITSAKIVDATITISDLAANSIDSLNVIDDSLTSADILNGTISTVDIANNSVTFDKIADGSVGAFKVMSNEVQLRVSGSCSAGDFVISVNEDGTVNCASIGMINGAEIVSGSITATQLANAAVTTDKIDLAAVNGFNIADNSITTLKIANGSVDTDDIATASITSAKIQNNTIVSEDVDATGIQLRVTGNCAIGSFISSINEDGSVNCGSDDSGLTSITTSEIVNATILNEDIANDTITAAKIVANTLSANEIGTNAINTDEIAPNAVTSNKISTDAVTIDEIAPNAVGSSEIISSQVQRRVSSICSDSYYLVGINEDGSVICKRLPLGFDFKLDSLGDVGLYTSIAIGADNNPIISYYDAVNEDLKVMKCSTVNCRNINTSVTLDSIGSVGKYTSIAVGSDNNPIISFHDETNGDLKVVKCTTINCNSFNTPLTLDSTGIVGHDTSIAIGSDNNPIISYHDFTVGDLKVVKCTAINCSSFNTPVSLGLGGVVGENTSISIGSNGIPMISYYDLSLASLIVAQCIDTNCSGFNILSSLDTNSGLDTSIAIGSDNNPVISYYDYTNDDLKVVKCISTNCSYANSPVTLDATGDIGKYTSIAIGIDDNPIISYFGQTNGELKIVKCSTVDCSTFNTPVTLDSIGIVGQYTSIAIGTDNNPIISYYDTDNGDLKVYSCGDPECSR